MARDKKMQLIKVWNKPPTWIEVPADATPEYIAQRKTKFMEGMKAPIKSDPEFEQLEKTAPKVKEPKYRGEGLKVMSTIIDGHRIGRF